MSHSTPLKDRTFSIPPQNGHYSHVYGHSSTLAERTTIIGDGEHLSPLEPVGGPHLGAQGAKPPLDLNLKLRLPNFGTLGGEVEDGDT